MRTVVAGLCAALVVAIAPPALAETVIRPGDLVARDAEGRLWVHPQTGDASAPWSASRQLVGAGWARPNVMQLSDVSLDGRLDLFTRDPAGDGSVGFHPQQTWDPNTRVLGMSGWNSAAAALLEDIDRDGRPDLLARQAGGNLRVWRHDGTTNATPWTSIPGYDVADGLEATDFVAFGDVTGDSYRDLIIREDDGAVWVLPHPGPAVATTKSLRATTKLWRFGSSRTQSTKQRLAAEPSEPYSVGGTWAEARRLDVQDVNGDGRPDLLATGANGLSVYYHDGAPAGENPWPAGVPVPGVPNDYTLVAASSVAKKADRLEVSPRTATIDAGTTQRFTARLVPANGQPRDVTNEVTWRSADPSVATISSGGLATGIANGRTAILASLGTASTGVVGLAVGTTPTPDQQVRAGDAIAIDADGRMWLYRQTGDPRQPWSITTRQNIGSDWSGPNVLGLADLTLDGKVDLFYREPGGTGVVWHHPQQAVPPAPHPYDAVERIFGMSGWNNSSAVLLEDVNGDGREDLLSRMPDGNLRFWLHDGKTDTTPWFTAGWSDIALGLNDISIVRFGEVTGDGRRDLVIRATDGSLWVLPHTGVPVGNGTPPVWTWDLAQARANADPNDPTKPYEVGTRWAASTTVDLQDVNADGRADLLAIDAAGTLTIALHDGTAAGRSPWPTSVPAGGWWGQHRVIAFSSPQ